MATGDIVNEIFPTFAVWHNFQPAAGVEIIITSSFGYTLQSVGLYNGVTRSNISIDYTVGNLTNIKVGINNTNYLSVYGTTTAPAYSGIQIK